LAHLFSYPPSACQQLRLREGVAAVSIFAVHILGAFALRFARKFNLAADGQLE